jgi:hypothetical protein
MVSYNEGPMRIIKGDIFKFFFSVRPLTLIRAAVKKCIEWRLQVQRAFLTEDDLAPSRLE